MAEKTTKTEKTYKQRLKIQFQQNSMLSKKPKRRQKKR